MKGSANKVGATLVLLLGVFLLAGCELDTIAEVKADPYRFQDKTAHLGGIVTRSYGALQYGVYEIEDRTGKIFVVSEKGVPARGARIEVKGKAVNAFTLAGVDYGTVIRENSRKIHKP